MVYRQCYDGDNRRLAKLNGLRNHNITYAKTNFNMLLNTNISFLERTINYFIAQCLAIVIMVIKKHVIVYITNILAIWICT